MKKIALLTLLLFAFVNFGCANDTNANDGLTWVENLDQAVKIAKTENKNILVNFTGSDWCIWCKRLNNEVFVQDAFKNYAKDNLVLVKLDFPRSIEQSPEQKAYNNRLAQQFGVRGFPTIFLLNKDGKAVNQTGYQAGGPVEYVKHLKKLLGQS